MTEVLVRPSGASWAVVLDEALVTLRDTEKEAIDFGEAVASSHLPSTLTIRRVDGSVGVTNFAGNRFTGLAPRRAWKRVVNWFRGAQKQS